MSLRTFALVLLLPLPVWMGGSMARADIPVPARLMQPVTSAEAWNVIRLALDNARRLFAEDRVEEVRDQVALLSPALRFLSRDGALSGRQPDAERIATEAFVSINLLVRESMAGNAEGARALFDLLESSIKLLAAQFDPTHSSVEIYSCVDHAEVAEAGAGLKCPDCGKDLRPRRFPYSVILARTDSPDLRLDLRTPSPLEVGRENSVDLRLTDSRGEAATEADLVVSHSRRVHLLIVDETGTDFHHLAPEPINEPGSYRAVFIPSSATSYRAWVLAVPASTRLPEALPAILLGRETVKLTPPDPGKVEELLQADGDGIKVRLVLPAGLSRLRAGKTHLVHLQVTTTDGKPIQQLEPLWNAFAHVSLVSWDFASVWQVHPAGGEILSETLRGGPYLSLRMHPPEAGWWRLFVQIRHGGRTLTFPLQILAEH